MTNHIKINETKPPQTPIELCKSAGIWDKIEGDVSLSVYRNDSGQWEADLELPEGVTLTDSETKAVRTELDKVLEAKG